MLRLRQRAAGNQETPTRLGEQVALGEDGQPLEQIDVASDAVPLEAQHTRGGLAQEGEQNGRERVAFEFAGDRDGCLGFGPRPIETAPERRLERHEQLRHPERLEQETLRESGTVLEQTHLRLRRRRHDHNRDLFVQAAKVIDDAPPLDARDEVLDQDQVWPPIFELDEPGLTIAAERRPEARSGKDLDQLVADSGVVLDDQNVGAS